MEQLKKILSLMFIIFCSVLCESFYTLIEYSNYTSTMVYNVIIVLKQETLFFQSSYMYLKNHGVLRWVYSVFLKLPAEIPTKRVS